MNYEQAIAFLQSFPDSERGLSGDKPGRHLKMPLSTMRLLLESLGNPQNATKTIHITGSKGKGSTGTFINHIFHQAGFKTALFTSPHLHSYRERFLFDFKPVSKEKFVEGISDLRPYIEQFDQEGHIISTFGILTALFFHLVRMSQIPIDWQIVEVGLGGKDDATNVFAKKEAVVITPISLEHTAILGTTRVAIAENKAGIITPESLVVVAVQKDKSVEGTIKVMCSQKSAHLIQATPPINLPCSLKMPGEHQRNNAFTALILAQALRKKGYPISEEAIKSGLSSAFLPGRFEVFALEAAQNIFRSHGPTDSDAHNNSTTIVLDGAHNGDSAVVLAETLQSIFPNRPVNFIIGINQDKNLEDIWLAVKNKALKLIATRSENYRALPVSEIRQRVLKCDPTAQVICTENIDQALKLAIGDRQPNNDVGNLICICGSLYLVAEARERLLQLEPEFGSA